MREFLKKPGVPGVFDYENAKQFEKNIELYKDLKEWWATLKGAIPEKDRVKAKSHSAQ